jgi:spore coat protein H
MDRTLRRFLPGPPGVVWHSRVRCLLFLFCAWLTVLCGQAAMSYMLPGPDIFEGTNLLHLAVEIPPEGVQALTSRRGRRGRDDKPRAVATIRENGHVFTNVTVQLKGFTTFQAIDELPSLTLDFNKLAPKQKFHGLTKISLNNSLQDITRLHEKLSRELFAAAGVPVPRADYALVTLNGRELGLYVLAEGFDKTFLKRHFKLTEGKLYEGGTLRDIDQGLGLSGGRVPTNNAGVDRLLAAARESDPDRRWLALNAALDMDRFLSMMAMETILCHSDSYSMNRNNYRIYHDPATDKMVFMPHGMDRVLGTHRSALDLPVVPPVLGVVARAVLSTPEGRRRHVERVGILFTNFFDPDQLCRRVREIDARITGIKTNQPPDQRFDRRPGRRASDDADNLCARISERAVEVRRQLAHPEFLLVPAPATKFDTNGVASVVDWKMKESAAQREALYTAKEEGQTLHLRAVNGSGPSRALLCTRVVLPVGQYRLTGRVQATDSTSVTEVVPSFTVQRYSIERFGVTQHRVDGRNISIAFQVHEVRAPEEIELRCEFQSHEPELWFDASALKLLEVRNQ